MHCLTTRQLNYYNTLPFKIQDLQESNYSKDKEIHTLKFAAAKFSISINDREREIQDQIELNNLCDGRLKSKSDELDKANKKIRNKNFIICFGGGSLLGLLGYMEVTNLIKK